MPTYVLNGNTFVYPNAGDKPWWQQNHDLWAAMVSEVNALINANYFANPTVADGDMLYRNGSSVDRLGIGATNDVLRVSASGIPEWAPVTTITSPLTTNGDLFYYNTADARLPIGSAGQFLRVNGGIPTWETVALGGDVIGPVASIDGNVALFDGTTGKLLKMGNLNIDPVGNVSGVNNLNVSGQFTSSSVDAATSNLFRNSTTRTIGSVASIGEIARSTNGSYVTLSGTVQTVLSVTITTSGKPVKIMIMNNSTGGGIQSNPPVSGAASAIISLKRGGSALAISYVSSQDDITITVPTSIVYLDEVAAGTHTYTVDVNMSAGSGQFAPSKLVAYEI